MTAGTARGRLEEIAEVALALADHDGAALAVYEDIDDALDGLRNVEAELTTTEDA